MVIGLEKDQIIDINKLPEFSRLLGGGLVKVIGSGHAGHLKKVPLIKSFFKGLAPLFKEFLDSYEDKIPNEFSPIGF